MSELINFHDYKPENLSLHDAVVEGLSKPRKSIPPKFFYDERGSQLFEEICQQPEYYPPTVEKKLLAEIAGEVVALTGQGRVVIEPGAGSADKVRLLLDRLRPSAYVPMDISFDYLKSVAVELAQEYPWLRLHATCIDFTHSLPLPETVPVGPRLLFFPGSSIGNFDRSEAGQFLTMCRETVGDEGMMLIGVDTKKGEARLNAAYNDKAGVTAQFNINLLHRMRDELGVDCDPDDFAHRAFYNATAGRIEMHLVSKQAQTLRLNGYRFKLEQGESLHTENSYKYAPAEFIALAAKSGFRKLRYWQDGERLFAIYLLAAD